MPLNEVIKLNEKKCNVKTRLNKPLVKKKRFMQGGTIHYPSP